MAVVGMQKVQLLVHRDEAGELLCRLQARGAMEFTEVEDERLTREVPSAFEFNYVSSRLDFAVEFLRRYATPAKGLKAAIEGDKVAVDEAAADELTDTFFFTDLIDEVQNLEEALNTDRAKLKDLDREFALLTPWQKLASSLGSGLETENTKMITFVATEADRDALATALTNDSVAHALEVVEGSAATLSVRKDDVPTVMRLLAEVGVEVVELPRRRGTPAEEVERIGRAIVHTTERIAAHEVRLKELATELPKLQVAADVMHWRKTKHDRIAGADRAGSVLVFEGWCPKELVPELTRELATTGKLAHLEPIDPAEGEAPPVELENTSLMRPFETVTRLYGLPGYRDLDPTAFLAGFFFIFFGLSLTDVGYGLLLAVIGGFILWRYQVPKDARPLVWLLTLGGVSSFGIGLLFGGYLGIDPASLPGPLQSLVLFDPIASPLPVLFLTLGLGIAQVLFGIFLGIMREMKNGNLLGGVLDHGPWIVFFVTVLAYAAAAFGYLPGVGYGHAVMAAVLLIVATQGRKAESIPGKLFGGVAALYDSVGYFSDVLSYSRLLALGLATSAMAFAVNLIAGLVKDVAVVGPVLMVIILVIGHVFNLVVNLLGAFIHSARLQFVEFFGKFVTESGRPFKPFQRDERYVSIKSN